MIKFDDALTAAQALVKDLPKRLLADIKKGDVGVLADLHTDITFLQMAVEQLVQEREARSKK